MKKKYKKFENILSLDLNNISEKKINRDKPILITHVTEYLGNSYTGIFYKNNSNIIEEIEIQ